MLRWAVDEYDGPVAIRYPRGGDGEYTHTEFDPTKCVVTCREGKDIAIVSYGIMVNEALAAAQKLSDEGMDVAVIRLTQVSPLPAEQLLEALGAYRKVLVVEDTPTGSGIRESIAWCLRDRTECEVDGLDLGWSFATHGNIQSLYQQYGVDKSAICRAIKEVWQYEK